MNVTNFEQAFAVWIDESKKIIPVKEYPNGKVVSIENRDKGTEMINTCFKRF